MSTNVIEKDDYGTLVNKKVVIVKNTTDDKGQPTTEEVEGTVQASNPLGILIKPKGKVNFDLIELKDIEEVYTPAEGDKKFTRSRLKPVEEGKMRRHLLDRHAVNLEWVNSVSEEDAVKYHDSLDHEKLDLGHYHKAPSEDAPAEDAAPTDAE